MSKVGSDTYLYLSIESLPVAFRRDVKAEGNHIVVVSLYVCLFPIYQLLKDLESITLLLNPYEHIRRISQLLSVCLFPVYQLLRDLESITLLPNPYENTIVK